jgi:LysM repeat protein
MATGPSSIDRQMAPCQHASGIIRAELTRKLPLTLLVCLIIFFSACSTPEEVQPVIPTTTLFPYVKISPTAIETFALPTITAMPTSGPTPTPFVHIVQKDDTLLGIAIRYGVSLDDLLAANPGINPRILSIDQKIIIPGSVGDEEAGFIPTATPVPMDLSAVSCFPTSLDRLWCISTLRNEGESPLEGVSVIITLLDDRGQPIASQIAFNPLNLVPVGGIVPLAVSFSSPAPSFAYAVVTPLSAFPALMVEDRYLEMEINLELDERGGDGRSCRVVGTVELDDESTESGSGSVSILAVAVDEEDHAIGYRLWEGDLTNLSQDPIHFDIQVFSLGPLIDHVEILAEALAGLVEG